MRKTPRIWAFEAPCVHMAISVGVLLALFPIPMRSPPVLNRHAGRHGAPSGQAGAYPLAAV
eukprot:1193793-Prymnesium_polylepis.2